MAVVTITPQDVAASADAWIVHAFLAQEEIEAGEVVYRASSTGSDPWALVVGNDATKGRDVGQQRGIALNHAYPGQPLAVTLYDPVFTPGGALAQGETYWASDTPGKIIPTSDLTSLFYRIQIGTAISTTELSLNIYSTGATA